MKKNRALNNDQLMASEDMAVALASLKNLIITSKSTESDQELTDEQQKKLNEIFVKTKKERIRDLFIQKLKRGLLTNKPEQVRKVEEVKGPCGLLVEAIQFPQHLAHAVILTNVIVVLVLMILATLEGFIDNFRSNKNFGAVFALKIICLVINVLYFILKCSNKSFGNGQNHTYIHEVLRAYAKSGRLFLDFLTIAIQVATLIVPDVMGISAAFFFFLAIVLFFTLSDLIQIEAAYLHSEKAVLIWGLVKICLSNIIFAHFMATFILAMSWIDQQKNWMTKVGIDEEQWFVKYFYAFYWGTTIMMTVGFGDVLPGNPREVFITSFLEMFSCILLGYNISEIGHLISQLREKNEITNRKIAIFDRMVKSKKSEDNAKFSQLKKSIYNHIKQLNNGDNNMQYQLRAELLAELPVHLRKAYSQQANQRIFPSVLFFNRLKPSTVQEMAQKFQSKFYYAGENLIDTKEHIMILEQGSIGLGYKKRGSILNGQIFDQIQVKKEEKTILLTTAFLSIFAQKNYDLIAKQQSIVWSISHEDFFETLKESMIDYQYYFSVLHKHTINLDEWYSVECTRCSTQQIKSFHCIYNCPRIAYTPFKQIVVLKDISVGSQVMDQRKRRSKKRNEYSKISAFKHKKTFNKMIQQIDSVKKNFAHIIEDYQISIQGYRDEESLLSISQYGGISGFSREQFMDVMEAAIRKYETGYEAGFWDLELDSIQNYQFYFPNQNANRLQKTNVQKTCSLQEIYLRNRQINHIQYQQESSLILNT